MTPPPWILAIDFGTSNTAAAHADAGGGPVETLHLSHNRTTMSSSVFVESPDRILVGDVAVDRAAANPAGFLPAPKRSVPQGMVHVNGYDIPAGQPVSAVLTSVIDRAVTARGGVRPAGVVLTHPEDWTPRDVEVMVGAAVAAGVDAATVSTVSEPRAAAHFYSQHARLSEGSRIAVFDFGGGTLDIAVLRADGAGRFDVVAAGGDNSLGGKNFDALVRRWVDEQLDHSDPHLLEALRTTAPMADLQALDESIRRAKELLSEAPSATVVVPGRDGGARFQITRDEFEELISGELDRAVALSRRVLQDAGVGASGGLEALYLTGGSSRIPAVHEALRQVGPIATLDDPKTVVARGALLARGRRDLPQGRDEAGRPPTSPAGPFAAMGSGRTGDRPAPAATRPAAITPTLSTAPSTVPSSAPAGSVAQGGPSRRPGRIAAISAAAVVAMLAAGGLAWAVLGRDSDPAPTAGSPTPSSVAPGTPPSTQEAVLASLPPTLSSELDECKISGSTNSGGLELMCHIKRSSPLAGASAVYEHPSLTVSTDLNQAKSKVVSLRQGLARNSAYPEHQLLEDTSRVAAAQLDGPSASGAYSIDYANSSTGVMLMYFDAKGADGAKSFLSGAGLLS